MKSEPIEKIPRITIEDLDKVGLLSRGIEEGKILWESHYDRVTTIFEFWNGWMDEYDAEDDWLGGRAEWDEEYAAIPENRRPPRMMKEGWFRLKSVSEFFKKSPEAKGYYASEPRKLDQMIDIVTTPCAYGGMRFWMKCPVEECGRRVRTLYFVEDLLGCHRCHKIIYELQGMSKEARTHGKIIPPGRAREMLDGMKRFSYGGQPTKKFVRVERAIIRSEEAQRYRDQSLREYSARTRAFLEHARAVAERKAAKRAAAEKAAEK